ncbi:AcrB/AcrD/AcrF family protein [Rhodohalobacter sp. SW132]|uniref:efflux RND transporter permease subunit n=1 Tax=Rhodohalobacter sp. SW132 TaxID=2293433 RepID=UPI000E2715B1|nr:efflux RND transporter permease subunit [Rhodohalobacter sp. SW132]REL32880.1 AcrB/AcrD/AcrF family protein [Rhodohalobacter sp. SW132]
MLDSIIQTSIRERLVVIVAAVILVISGFFLTRDMAVDVLPDVSAPVVTVLTEAPGLPPEEVEQMISYPVETVLIGSEGVRRVTSNSIQGFSSVQVEFDWDVDVPRARQIVNEQLQGIGDQLPGQSGTPFLAPVTSIMGEIMLAGFTSETTPIMDLRTDVDFIVRRELLAMPGVAAVSVYGGDRQQFTIEPDPERMEMLGISLNGLMDAARESSAGISGGFLNHSGKAYTIRGFGRASGIEEIGQSVVSQTENGLPVLLQDVAGLSVKPAPRIGDASINAEPGIVLVISKQPDANTIELTRQIEERLNELAGSLPDDVTVHPDLFQQAHFINVAIGNVTKALLISGFLVVFILFIFLNNWRATVISLVAIPMSVILSLLVLWYGGFTFNTMTLGGIAIAIGVLVDDAIVFVENVFRRLQENNVQDESDRESFLAIVADASSEIKGPIVLANFAIVVVFLPFLFLTGLEGRLLMPLGVAYVTTIIASLLVALIVTPAMSAWLLVDSGNQPNEKSRLTRFLENSYQPILEFCFRWRKAVLIVVLLLFAVSVALIPGIGRSFLPEFNEGTLNVGMTTLPGTSLEESNKLGLKLEEMLLDHPAVISTGRRVGRAQMDEHTMGTHAHEIEVRLDENGYESMSELMDELRHSLELLPGAGISLDQPITHRIDHMLTGVRTNLAVKVYGPDRTRLQSISRQVESVLRSEENAQDILTEEQRDIPQLQILPDRSSLAMHGLSMGRFAELVETAFGGVVVDQIYRDPAVFDLVVRYSESHRESPDAVKRTPIELPSGAFIRVSDVADVRVSNAPETITRENASRMMVTQANITGGDLRGTVDRLRQSVNEEIDLSGGYVIAFEGQFQQEEEASRVILLVSLLSMILIFLALFIEFRSAKQSLLILLNLPLALMGGIVVVYLGGGILSIAGLIGFITLFGIAVRNGIILIARYNDLIAKQTMTIREAVIEGSMNRLQPILMTVVTTALALIPLVLAANQPGNEIQGPMATVILGGLISATALNMIVVPLLFDWYFRER